ncbi:MAG TPA: chromosomal replication initiator protein DnaA [Clostridia bacterium]|nr:chromosomal replication initiator protein DnaA [Clostridia bacterium]
MNQLQAVWHRTRENLKAQMNSVSYGTFIEVLSPLAVVDNTLVLEAPNPMTQSTVNKYYIDTLCESALSSNDCIDKILIVLPQDRADYVQDPNLGSLSSNLFSKYTFSTFVVGNSNYFAHAAALAVSKNPAKSYNPLFLYGGVGLGKTHLMHAIGHNVKSSNSRASVMYVTSETFTNEMIQSISTNRNKEFRNRYRNVDVLMVDDIQFIAKKEGVQEEFFHTFNTLHAANKQIVISSDKPPREIAQLEERLRSRFEWGLIADIQPPDLETRIAILKKRAEQENMRVPSSVLEYIAERVQSNIRELEGLLTRVVAYAQFNRLELNDNVAACALKDMLPDNAPRVLTPSIIQETVAQYYGLNSEAFLAKRRDQEVAFPRQIAMYLSRNMTDWSLPKIGDAFGGRNHTTVMHAHDKITAQLKADPALNATVEDLKKRLLTS